MVVVQPAQQPAAATGATGAADAAGDPAGWGGHVVVAGLEADGLRVVEQLHAAGVAVAVVDDGSADVALVAAVRAWDVPVQRGDSRDPAVLAAAGLAGAVALVCVHGDDPHALATALVARQAGGGAGLRVVVQLRNPAVGRALAAAGVAVLDVAALSAPSVVQARLGDGVHPLRLGGEDFVVVEARPDRRASLRDLYGDLAPLAVVPDGGRTELSPGRDRVVGPGDAAVVVGEAREVADAGLLPAPPRSGPVPGAFTGARAPRPVRRRPEGLLRSVGGAVEGRLRLVIVLLLALAATSVVVLVAGYQDADGRRTSVLDAVCFTVETIATVGFGDYCFRDQAPWLRLWAVALVVVGATPATVTFALLTNALVSRRLEERLGQRRVTGLEHHAVVVGLGAVGLEVVRQLRARDVPVLVVDGDPGNRLAEQVRADGVPVLVADATLPAVLERAGMAHARAVAVVTSDDLVNVETALAVRDGLGARWARVPVVVRVTDRRLASALADALDFRHVRSTAALAAPSFVGAALGLDVLATFYVGDVPLLVARLVVRAGGGLEGVAMAELPGLVRVVSLQRGGSGPSEHPPRRGTRLAAGDAAHLVGPYEELLALLRTDAAPLAAPPDPPS